MVMNVAAKRDSIAVVDWKARLCFRDGGVYSLWFNVIWKLVRGGFQNSQTHQRENFCQFSKLDGCEVTLSLMYRWQFGYRKEAIITL